MESNAHALVDACRRHAAAGTWRALRDVLTARRAEAAQSSTLIPLYAEALMRTGDPRSAQHWLLEHQTMLRLGGDQSAMRRAANLSGAASLELGEVDNAQGSFEHALDLGRRDGDDLLVARVTNNLAVIATIRGRHAEALGLYTAAIPAYQRVGNVNGIAESYHNMAIALRKLEQLEAAEEHERRAAEYARQVPNERLVAMTLVGRAEISLLRGDAALADARARRAAQDLAAIPDPARQADAIRLSGVARWALRQVVEARAALDDAVALAAAHGSLLIEAESRWARAQVAHDQGDAIKAIADAERAASMFEQLEAPLDHAAVTAWLLEHRRNPE